MSEPKSELVSQYAAASRRKISLVGAMRLFLESGRANRELILQLFRRDFLAQHKKAFLGYTWIFLAPLFGVASWIFLNRLGVLNPGPVGVPYPLYVLMGSSLWGFWMALFKASSETLSSGQSLMNQVKFAHDALLIKQVLQQTVAFCVSLAFNLVLLYTFGIEFRASILLLPLVLLPLVLLGAGVGLLVSMITIVVTDIAGLLNAGFGILLYLTPILYAPDTVTSRWGFLMNLNPLVHLVCSPRDWVLYGRLYDTQGFLWSSLAGFVLFLLSLRAFYVSEARLIEKMV